MNIRSTTSAESQLRKWLAISDELLRGQVPAGLRWRHTAEGGAAAYLLAVGEHPPIDVGGLEWLDEGLLQLAAVNESSRLTLTSDVLRLWQSRWQACSDDFVAWHWRAQGGAHVLEALTGDWPEGILKLPLGPDDVQPAFPFAEGECNAGPQPAAVAAKTAQAADRARWHAEQAHIHLAALDLPAGTDLPRDLLLACFARVDGLGLELTDAVAFGAGVEDVADRDFDEEIASQEVNSALATTPDLEQVIAAAAEAVDDATWRLFWRIADAPEAFEGLHEAMELLSRCQVELNRELARIRKVSHKAG